VSASSQIPRIIHYCWFGRGPKPKLVLKCISSWQKQLNGYQFIEWNEDSFDIHSNRYVKEAYAARKYAFVSDYVRLHALYHQGGIYMDTDVEVLKPLDRFLDHDAFSGFEDEHFLQSGTMGAVREHPWIGELLLDYDNRSFVREDGSFDQTTNTAVISRISAGHGLVLNGEHQVLAGGVVFFPRTYSSPYDYINGANFITSDSYTIHHFAQSWLPAHVRMRSSIKRAASRIVGPKFISKMRDML